MTCERLRRTQRSGMIVRSTSAQVRRLGAGGLGVGVTGARGRCPVCAAALWAADSELVGRRDCPRCGAELWVLVFSRGPVFFPRRPGESLGDLLSALGAPGVGAGDGEFEAVLSGLDSLDIVELLL